MSARSVETSGPPVSSQVGNPGTNGSQKETELTATPAPTKSEPLVPQLQTLETQIEQNKGRPLVMGRDLKVIRDRRLYKQSGKTWDAYCQERFRFGKRAADYYIAVWVTAQNCGAPDDLSPRSLRPLTKLTPEHQKSAWSKAVATTKNGRPSPRDIQVSASRFTTKPVSEWTAHAAHAVHERHFRIGLKKALAGATEQQVAEYCGRLEEYALDWAERHSVAPATFDVDAAIERVKKFLIHELDRWPAIHRHIFLDAMAEVVSTSSTDTRS